MSIGKRRPKLSRANLRPSAATVSLKQDRQARQRIRLALLGLVAASLAATTVIVHGSGPPFTYRIGERPDRELRVNVKEFHIRNQTKTSNERQAAADQVAPVMINDPAPIRELADRLDDLTATIAKAVALRRDPRDRPHHLGTPSRGVRRAQGRHRHPGAARHAPVAGRPPHSGPIIRDGVLGTGTPAAQRGIEPDPLDPPARTSRSRSPGRSLASASSPSGMIKPDGPVYQEFCGAFTSPRIGQTLFGLIGNRLDTTPTLTYEAEATASLREAATEGRPGQVRHLHPRRSPRRAGPGHRRGAAHPAAPGTRRRHGEPRLRRPRATGTRHPRPGRGALRLDGILPLQARGPLHPRARPHRHDLRARDPGARRRSRPRHADLGRRAGPGRHRLDDRRDRLQPQLRADGHLRALGAHLRRPGDRHPPLPGHHGRDGRGCPDPHRGPHAHQADQGRGHGVAHLLPADLGHRLLARPARSIWSAATASGAPAGA